MRVYRDISNRPINEIETYPWGDLFKYDLVIFRDEAALGRVDELTLEEPIRILEDMGAKVLLWSSFSSIMRGDPESDWRYRRRLVELDEWIAKTPGGEDAVIWLDRNPDRNGYHLDPHRVRPEEYGPWVAYAAKEVGASGVLLDFIDPLGKPWTPPPFVAPAFATTQKGLNAFDNYRKRTLFWLREREGLLVYANGRGPQVETPWYNEETGIQGCYWEQFGAMHRQGAEACLELQKMNRLELGHHLLDPGTSPCWAEASAALLDGPSVVEDVSV